MRYKIKSYILKSPCSDSTVKALLNSPSVNEVHAFSAPFTASKTLKDIVSGLGDAQYLLIYNNTNTSSRARTP